MESASDDLVGLRRALERETRRLHVLHAERLTCHRGCAACCVDELTVFEVEAAPIRRRYAALLAEGRPHAEGACAFLDADGGCRIYDERPYVCRTQGLPLRWLEEADSGEAIVERRDICPRNEAGADIVELASDDCWTIGPVEERLARMQHACDGGEGRRVPLRSLFAGEGRASE